MVGGRAFGGMALVLMALVLMALGAPPRAYALEALDTNYVLAGRNVETNAEMITFQISIGQPVYEGFWVSYQQRSWWDVGEESRPFRETNFNPSAFYRWRDTEGAREVRIGYEHESNGQADVARIDGITPTRSWDRLYAEVAWPLSEWLTLRPKVWYAYGLEDNPALLETYGHGQLGLGFHYRPATIDLWYNGRHGGKRGWQTLDLFYGWSWGWRVHVQWFDGYGESLIDLPGKDDSFSPERRTVWRIGVAITS
jgi:phospholipase A1